MAAYEWRSQKQIIFYFNHLQNIKVLSTFLVSHKSIAVHVLIDLFTVYVILGLVICFIAPAQWSQKQNGDSGFESAESNPPTFFLLKSSLSVYFAYISIFL